MDAVIFRPLAVPDLNHVVVAYEQKNHGDDKQVALANFADWQRQNRSFEELAVHSDSHMSLTGAGNASQVWAENASRRSSACCGPTRFWAGSSIKVRRKQAATAWPCSATHSGNRILGPIQVLWGTLSSWTSTPTS